MTAEPSASVRELGSGLAEGLVGMAIKIRQPEHTRDYPHSPTHRSSRAGTSNASIRTGHGTRYGGARRTACRAGCRRVT
ncbi:hypothetical protein GCM10011579_073590 [Streptomyces albiflavescens]|uniref:Uncharacterized protein n=1 Tax=Streptomyces albiflavescens TaxID=1623582 RepID=A0A917YD36_9ACTN|nr:hypothetical protein GCM10011579_073590 [Streptomyces albiflavescens]